MVLVEYVVVRVQSGLSPFYPHIITMKSVETHLKNMFVFELAR